MNGTGKLGRRRIGRLIALFVTILVSGGMVSTSAQGERQERRPQPPGQWDQNRTQTQQAQQAQSGDFVLMSDLLGASVKDRGGNEIGQVDDIVFDQDHRQVLYAVISSGGSFSTWGNRHAVPWFMVSTNQSGDEVTLPIDGQTLQKRTPIGPEYPTEQLDQTARAWTNLDRWEQSQPQPTQRNFAQQETTDQMRRGTALTGLEIKFNPTGVDDYANRSDNGNSDVRPPGDFNRPRQQQQQSDYNRESSEIEDLVISRNGTLDFALVQPAEEFLRVGDDQFLAMPWALVEVQSNQETAEVDLTAEEARKLVLGENDINRLSERDFRNRMYSSVGLDYFAWQGDTQGQSNGGSRERAGRTQPGTKVNESQMQEWSNLMNRCLGGDLNRSNLLFNGRVTDVGPVRASGQSESPGGHSMMVTTDNNARMRVYLGAIDPNSGPAKIRPGTDVVVRGSECELDNVDWVIATSIEADGERYTLGHGDRGTFQWEQENLQYGQRGSQFDRPTGGDPRTQEALEKWSNFSQQCLGQNFDRATSMVSGTVRSTGTFYTDENAEAPDGHRITLRTRDNQRVIVYTGPSAQFDGGPNVSRGDEITIQGARCEIDNRQVLVASTIQTEDRVYTLTERNGVPTWESDNSGQRNQPGGRR